MKKMNNNRYHKDRPELNENDFRKCFNKLEVRDRQIIKLYFGMEGKYPHTLQEIGNKLGISRERVRQLRNRALKKWKRALEETDIDVEIMAHKKFYYTIKETADILHIPCEMVQEYIKSKKLKIIQGKNRKLISSKEIVKFIEEENNGRTIK